MEQEDNSELLKLVHAMAQAQGPFPVRVGQPMGRPIKAKTYFTELVDMALRGLVETGDSIWQQSTEEGASIYDEE
jgi:hypothetical protein